MKTKKIRKKILNGDNYYLSRIKKLAKKIDSLEYWVNYVKSDETFSGKKEIEIEEWRIEQDIDRLSRKIEWYKKKI